MSTGSEARESPSVGQSAHSLDLMVGLFFALLCPRNKSKTSTIPFSRANSSALLPEYFLLLKLIPCSTKNCAIAICPRSTAANNAFAAMFGSPNSAAPDPIRSRKISRFPTSAAKTMGGDQPHGRLGSVPCLSNILRVGISSSQMHLANIVSGLLGTLWISLTFGFPPAANRTGSKS